MNRGVYRLALVRPSFSLGVRWVLGLAWVVRACGVLRDICWACWRRARSAYLALARDDARPVRRLPDVEPYDDFRSSRWCHGGILQSVSRSEAFPRHSHYLAVAPGPGSFLSVVRSGERLRWQRPPRPSSGQGQTAIRRRPIGGPSGLARIVGNAPNARHRSSSVAYYGL